MWILFRQLGEGLVAMTPTWVSLLSSPRFYQGTQQGLIPGEHRFAFNQANY